MAGKATTEEDKEQQAGQDEAGFVPYPVAEPEDSDKETTPAGAGQPEGDKKPGEAEEPPAFQLIGFPEEEPESEKKPGESEAGEEGDQQEVRIVHNGQVHTLTLEKALKLAQKGFDYDTKVGPHGKFVQMIEANPAFAKRVNDVWQEVVMGAKPDGAEKGEKPPKKTPPTIEVKPLEEYESERDWLKANNEALLGAVTTLLQDTIAEKPEKPVAAAQPDMTKPENQAMAVRSLLVSRDPEFADAVIPKLEEYGQFLSQKDYTAVNTHLPTLLRFYDFVKEKERSKILPPGEGKRRPGYHPPQPTFKVRSGGRANVRPEEDTDYAWNLPRDKFQQTLDKAKGFI